MHIPPRLLSILVISFHSFFLGNGSLMAQHEFDPVTRWLEQHTPEMGGRAILMIYKNGEIVYSHAVNQLNNRQKMANRYMARRMNQTADLNDYTPQTRIPIASCSKWLSAALVMTFVDEGKLSLSDTVGRFLPVLSRNGKGGISIAQCLSHCTGIKAPPLRENLQDMKNISSMSAAIDQIAAMPMEGEPGTVFHYSNVGLQIAGAVLEKISGQRFETLFAERIARPLNMTQTDFGHKAVALPAGGAYSSPNDYMHFLEMILHAGVYQGRRVLSEASVRQMQQNRLTADIRIAYSPAEAGKFGYALGEWVMTENGSVTSPGLFGSFPWLDNEKGYCAFLMTFYLKNEGRHQRYLDLKDLVDKALAPASGE